MKNCVFILGILSFAVPAFATSGKFVCKSDEDVNYYWNTAQVADAVNSLNCDTTKPVNISRGDKSTLVCCVQK